MALYSEVCKISAFYAEMLLFISNGHLKFKSTGFNISSDWVKKWWKMMNQEKKSMIVWRRNREAVLCWFSSADSMLSDRLLKPCLVLEPMLLAVQVSCNQLSFSNSIVQLLVHVV